MRSVKVCMMAGAIAGFSLAAGAANAADYPQPQPIFVQPQPQPIPVMEDFAEGWYLRGDVGVGSQKMSSFDFLRNPAAGPTDFHIETASLGDSAFVGFGIGYEYNNWLRFDVTGEYRTRASVFAFGSYQDGGPPTLDIYNAHLKSYVFLANAYVDLGTWWCFTPFVGLGAGGAYKTFDDLTDFSTNNGRGFGRAKSDWDFAWAVHAGVAYNATKNLKIELAYRYLNMGSIETAIDCVGGCLADSYRIKDVTSHDIKLGLRWLCCEDEPVKRVTYAPPPTYIPPPQPQVVTAPPVYAQPQPQYVQPQPQYAPPPPPVYHQPPLMRKG